MTEYAIEIDAGHLILYLGEYQGLIDTGAPTSFGQLAKLNVCNNDFKIPTEYFGIKVQEISKFINRDLDFVIGMDILSKFDIVFTKQTMTLHKPKSLKIEGSIKMKNIMGIPIIPITVEGKNVDSIFDTGAKISYIQDHLLDGKEVISKFKDFHPFSGHFETSVYESQVEIGESKMKIQAGTTSDLPDMVKLSVMNNCIIGSSILDDYDVIVSIPQNSFGLKKN